MDAIKSVDSNMHNRAIPVGGKREGPLMKGVSYLREVSHDGSMRAPLWPETSDPRAYPAQTDLCYTGLPRSSSAELKSSEPER